MGSDCIISFIQKETHKCAVHLRLSLGVSRLVSDMILDETTQNQCLVGVGVVLVLLAQSIDRRRYPRRILIILKTVANLTIGGLHGPIEVLIELNEVFCNTWVVGRGAPFDRRLAPRRRWWLAPQRWALGCSGLVLKIGHRNRKLNSI